MMVLEETSGMSSDLTIVSLGNDPPITLSLFFKKTYFVNSVLNVTDQMRQFYKNLNAKAIYLHNAVAKHY